MSIFKKKNIIITGFLAAGKTNIGFYLSKVFSYKFIDLDILISKIFKFSISQFIYLKGEFYFRNIEIKILNLILKKKNILVSTGGGTLLNLISIFSFFDFFIFCFNNDINNILFRILKDYEIRFINYNINYEFLLNTRFYFYSRIFYFINLFNEEKKYVFLKIFKILKFSKYFYNDIFFYVNDKINKNYPIIINKKKKINLYKIFSFLNIEYSKFFFFFDKNINITFFNLIFDYKFIDFFFLKKKNYFKNLNILKYLYLKFLNFHFNNRDLIIICGGGLLTDLMSFICSSYYRGINFIFFPTTYLNLTDASIGGKNAVDFFSKNIIGFYKNPLLIFINFFFLKSIYLKYLNYSISETFKHSLLLNKKILKFLYKSKILDFYKISINSIIVKIKIISLDPYEKNKRILLNLFHSLSHSLEKTSYFILGHSKSIILSIFLIFSISFKINILLNSFFFSFFYFLFKKLSLSFKIHSFYYYKYFLNNLFFDKKNDIHKNMLLIFYNNKFLYLKNLRSDIIFNSYIKFILV